MKKMIDTAATYAVLAIVCGVFYREFTKFFDFTGKTTLAFTHLHFMVLGTFMFLILALFSLQSDFVNQKNFKKFYMTYNVALPYIVIMFFVRGIMQVLNTPLSKGANAAISGMAGIGHIIMCVALYFLFSCLRNIKTTSTVKR